jgi:serine/threonine protein kinase/Tfp pilus assembly protein PilF
VTPERWNQVKEVFHQALGLDEGRRAAFLARACSGDENLRREVDLLISGHNQAGSFISAPPDQCATELMARRQGSLMPGQVIGHYEIAAHLGSGGMGEVYLAEDSKLGRKVAIKLLPHKLLGDKQAKSRLLREARAAAKLDHPNICAIYEVGEDRNITYIAMQYVEGETLASLIKSKPLGLNESLDVGTQVASALGEAHSHGIIHRDIKPQNIILNPRGQVKVLDFGVAKIVHLDQAPDSKAETESLLTGEGMILGTVGYMSPEQARSDPTDARSDLFSLGAVLYECVTGRAAFSGSSLMEIWAQVIHVDPPAPSRIDPSVPPKLDQVILKALAKKAEERYQSAVEVLTELRDVRDMFYSGAAAQPTVVEPRPPLVRILRTISTVFRRNTLLTAALTILILLVALVAISRFSRRAHYQLSPEARRWYDAGLQAIHEGAYFQATKALERTINLDAKFPLGHARLAEAWAELDYADRAKDELLSATSLVPDRAALPRMDALYLEAVTAVLRQDFPDAVDKYSKIVEQAVDSEKSSAYFDLGRAHEKNEDTAKALESYLEATKCDSQYAAAFMRQGILYGRQQNFKSALEAFDKAEGIYQALSNLEGVTEVLYQRGQLLNLEDKVAEARSQLEKALGITRTTNNKYQQINTLLRLSSVCFTEGNTSLAEQYATQATDLARANNLENLATNGIIDLGNAFFVRGDYLKAETYFRQAIDFARRYKGRRSENRGLLSLGSLRVQQGIPDEGLGYLEQALTFYQQGGYRTETSQALILLGRAYHQKGDYDAALRAFEQQLKLAEESGDLSQIASAHTSIGTLTGDQERYTEALRHYEASYKINESLGAKMNIGYDLMNRGDMLWSLGRYREARASLDQASSIATSPQAALKQLMALIYLANARLALSELSLREAKARAQQALDLASQYKDIALRAGSTLGLADALSGSASAGKSLCDQAVTMAKETGNPLSLSSALLALAEVWLRIGDAQNALATALQAQAAFDRFGQLDSEWRAYLIAGLASHQVGDEQSAHRYASEAAKLLSSLQERLGVEDYRSYLARPDVRSLRMQLDQVLEVVH